MNANVPPEGELGVEHVVIDVWEIVPSRGLWVFGCELAVWWRFAFVMAMMRGSVRCDTGFGVGSLLL